MRKELENRLVQLSLSIERLCKGLDKSYMTDQLSMQIIRSSTSEALNYGEAHAAESKNAFIHKISIVLKELRETEISLKLLSGSVLDSKRSQMESCQDEFSQLIAFFHKTVMTARRNRNL
jgi:four helix bundle protein